MAEVLLDLLSPVLAWTAALTAASAYWRGRRQSKNAKTAPFRTGEPSGAVVEIVEKDAATADSGGGSVIVPNDVRINGQSLLASADEPVVVHQVSTNADDCVRVTLTLLARRVSIRAENDAA